MLCGAFCERITRNSRTWTSTDTLAVVGRAGRARGAVLQSRWLVPHTCGTSSVHAFLLPTVTLLHSGLPIHWTGLLERPSLSVLLKAEEEETLDERKSRMRVLVVQ
jgi:hypothetical protein